MGIALGNNNVNKIYYGSSEVSKVYLGTTQVYPNQSTVQYIPNPTMTEFLNYQTRTIEGGRYLNVEPSEDLLLKDYPVFSFGNYNPIEGGILFIRIYGQVTAQSYADFDSFYNLNYFTFFDGARSTRSIQLRHLTNDTFPLHCNNSNTNLSLTTGQYFCVDLMPTDQSLLLTTPKLRLCNENGSVISTQAGTGFPSATVLSSDKFLLGAYLTNTTYGCPANILKLDLLKSGIYYIAGDGTYLRDNPNEAVLFENRSIMIQQGE